jgi:hypothetical protein
VLGGLTVRGSIVGTPRGLENVFELHRRGLTKVFRSGRSLDDVNEATEQALDGTDPSLVVSPLSVAPTASRDQCRDRGLTRTATRVDRADRGRPARRDPGHGERRASASAHSSARARCRYGARRGAPPRAAFRHGAPW